MEFHANSDKISFDSELGTVSELDGSLELLKWTHLSATAEWNNETKSTEVIIYKNGVSVANGIFENAAILDLPDYTHALGTNGETFYEGFIWSF